MYLIWTVASCFIYLSIFLLYQGCISYIKICMCSVKIFTIVSTTPLRFLMILFCYSYEWGGKVHKDPEKPGHRVVPGSDRQRNPHAVCHLSILAVPWSDSMWCSHRGCCRRTRGEISTNHVLNIYTRVQETDRASPEGGVHV